MCRWVRVCAAMDEGVGHMRCGLCEWMVCQMACMCVGHASTLMWVWRRSNGPRRVVPLILNNTRTPWGGHQLKSKQVA